MAYSEKKQRSKDHAAWLNEKLIIFCYNVLVVAIALIAFSVTTRNGVQFAAAVACRLLAM